jgi:hypothetical protein
MQDCSKAINVKEPHLQQGDAAGRAAWWDRGTDVTVHRLMVHLCLSCSTWVQDQGVVNVPQLDRHVASVYVNAERGAQREESSLRKTTRRVWRCTSALVPSQLYQSNSPSSKTLPGGGGGDWVVTQPNRTSWAKSQQIVATRPLYCLQYPLASQSSAEDLPRREKKLSCSAPESGL